MFKWKKYVWGSCLLMVVSGSGYAQTPAGVGFFQSTNYDDSYYPRTAAPQAVSVTPVNPVMANNNPNHISAPYRLHSWLGGMLWGTWANPQSTYSTPSTEDASSQWVSTVFPQKPVWADPVILEYQNSPNSGGAANAAGINVCLPYPYLMQDAPYSTCGGNWSIPPLQIQANSLQNVLVQPLSAAPTATGAQTPVWLPTATLVDRMGDWDVDLIFQDPANPYAYTAFNQPGIGNYIKFTVAQGSPYVFVECNGISFINLANRMPVIQPLSGSSAVTGVSNVSYALIGGNQNSPGIFAGTASLNPNGNQDNFTTWAIFFKTSNGTNGASYTASSASTIPANNYLQFDNGNGKNWFVIAAVPTVMDYPTQHLTYTAATTTATTNVNNYAQALGQYAFNFLTNTQISYTVTDYTFVQTTFQTTLANPYMDNSMVAGSATVMALSPHQYQNVTFATGYTPNVLQTLVTPPNYPQAFNPTNTSGLFYWNVRGNLKAILGPSFQTNYIFNNFLPTMPPVAWNDPISNPSNGFSSSIGQFIFDNIDNEYLGQANQAFAPWQTSYQTLDKGIYDVGKALSFSAKQLGILLEMIQATELNAVTFTEAQYNNQVNLVYRPGAFNPTNPAPVSQLTALRQALQTSIQGVPSGSLMQMPWYAGLEAAIGLYFSSSPVVSTGGSLLSHFAYYDSLSNTVELFPVSGDPSSTTPYASPINPPGPPSRVTSPPPTQIWEAFGVSALLDDHHYQYGYWISAAALSGIYDGSWNSTPTNGTWVTPSQYGTVIDQLVMDLAFDPGIPYNPANQGFYKVPGFSYAKMNFFDQWAGHGWADGLQGTLAGGLGHNENSIQEGNQAYASIILWGIATNRPEIVNLGIYLYTTATYAADAYFYDKNLNYMPGNPSGFFVPVTTAGSATYPDGTGFWDYTIHTSTSSGCPKMSQSGLNYSTDFGQTPPNIKFITAFPCAPWTLAIGRNTQYLNEWNASMDTPAFQSLISSTPTNCWQISYYGNMNMLRGLGGNTTGAYGTTQSVSPYQFMINELTEFYPNSPPWVNSTGSINNLDIMDPSQSASEVLHFLYTMQKWGTPDWSVYGNAGTNMAFTSAFTLDNGTHGTCWAFNPGLSPITVNFYRIGTVTPISTFTVAPKRWASGTY